MATISIDSVRAPFISTSSKGIPQEVALCIENENNRRFP
jgi:hypothetical protein